MGDLNTVKVNAAALPALSTATKRGSSSANKENTSLNTDMEKAQPHPDEAVTKADATARA